MAGGSSFEKTEVWNDARKLVREIFQITRSDLMKGEFFLQDQMKRGPLSVMANIAEGFERDGTRELIQFLSIAKGSAGELRSHLLAGYDMGLVRKEDFNGLYQTADSVGKQLSGLIKYLKNSGMKGRKY